MKVTSVFDKNLEAYNQRGVRIVANKGGTRSSKTYSLLQLLMLISIMSETPLMISIVSESLPHLKKGALRDFLSILDGEGLKEGKDYTYNRTDFIFKIGRSKIEFFSSDSPGKVHGPQRDILFINEANHIPYEVYRQLVIRTSFMVFLDWNPSAEFWFEEEKVNLRDDCVTIHSTYKDNEFLSPAQVREIESNMGNENWWRVYGLGLTGNREGLVFTNWEQVSASKWPAEFKRAWIGLDFGFTNDPTGILFVGLSGGQLWLRELCYETGLLNQDIAKIIKGSEFRSLEVVADSAEPKSIEEIRRLGVRIEPATKGNDSINVGIGVVQRYKLNVHEDSDNLIKELRQYEWKRDRITGKMMNEPIDKFNHLIDPLRYVALSKLFVKKKSVNRSTLGNY